VPDIEIEWASRIQYVRGIRAFHGECDARLRHVDDCVTAPSERGVNCGAETVSLRWRAEDQPLVGAETRRDPFIRRGASKDRQIERQVHDRAQCLCATVLDPKR
jgi:hypothetical protein